MEIDKQTVARRLIHAAIRSVIRQDDPLAAHVLIVGAFDLLRQYAKTKGIELRSDFLNRLPPDLAKEAIGGIENDL